VPTENVARVLCIDDEPSGLAVRRAVLEQSGYVVRTAASGDEALQILCAERIDVIISDHLLQGTTGTRVAIFMKLLHPDIPVLILSGLTESPEDMEFADAFLCKLERPPVLLSMIAKLLNGNSVAASNGS
jgi:CheY-like chemotaxis protein